ncbi:hypothetical protein [Actinokineospora inagensis]|uniref:hypothetical protein n=1 Tax=Actinokineospora inagensis TaxID=103730 RepID=UPI0003F4D140|nr:hypothetical protein [Actinokineospora inagensis]
MARGTRLTVVPTAQAPLWRGLDYGPAVVVLSPAAARPADLPVAWQPLEQLYQVAWCAIPPGADGAGSLDRVEDVLETLADRRTRTQVVAHTALTDVACRIAAEFPDIVRGLVLVGPGRTPEPTGVPTRRVTLAKTAVGPGALARPDVVDDITAALAAADHRAPREAESIRIRWTAPEAVGE